MLQRLMRIHRRVMAVVQHAQPLRLELWAQIPYLVDEEHASVGLAELPSPDLLSTGVSHLLLAEQRGPQ